MGSPQPGILAPVPPLARYLTFSLAPEANPRQVLASLCQLVDGEVIVLGLGHSLILSLGAKLSGLRDFPRHVGPGFAVPSTPAALWCWLRGGDRGELVHVSRRVQRLLSPVFQLDEVIDAFRYDIGRDLTGYEDGTENPEGEEAVAAAVVAGGERELDGSSFVAVQQWVHQLAHFQALPGEEQDFIIGRRKSDNVEIDDAPSSAHVKRTAQESFDPEAFVLRRSMPWADADGEGLVFTAFGKSFEAFEALLNRMVGAEDGIPDALFRFTRPVSGRYFWCPPLKDGHPDLTAVGL